jgi:hypothetical protein
MWGRSGFDPISTLVRYNFDKDIDFPKFKTCKWTALKDAMALDELTDRQINAAIDAELVKAE